MNVYHSLVLHLEREQLRASVIPITEGSLSLRIEESDCYSGVVLFIDNTPENLKTLEQICVLVASIKPRPEQEQEPLS